MIWFVIAGAIFAVVGFFFGYYGRKDASDGYMPQPEEGERLGLGIRREQDFVRYWRRSMRLGWFGVTLLVIGAIGLLIQYLA
ncbi:MAG: hypothetical protein ACK4V6_11115 [Microthrixaceae bacterium]